MNQIFMQTQSFLIICLLIFGITQAKKRNLHYKIMSAAITWDLLLILQVELARSAVMKAAKVMTNPMILNIHVSIAVTTVLLYIVMIFLGRQVLKGHSRFLPKHRVFGYITLLMRALTFVTSFLAPQGT